MRSELFFQLPDGPRKGADNVIRDLAQLQRDYDLSARLLVVGGEADEPDPQLTSRN